MQKKTTTKNTRIYDQPTKPIYILTGLCIHAGTIHIHICIGQLSLIYICTCTANYNHLISIDIDPLKKKTCSSQARIVGVI